MARTTTARAIAKRPFVGVAPLFARFGVRVPVFLTRDAGAFLRVFFATRLETLSRGFGGGAPGLAKNMHVVLVTWRTAADFSH